MLCCYFFIKYISFHHPIQSRARENFSCSHFFVVSILFLLLLQSFRTHRDDVVLNTQKRLKENKFQNPLNLNFNWILNGKSRNLLFSLKILYIIQSGKNCVTLSFCSKGSEFRPNLIAPINSTRVLVNFNEKTKVVEVSVE